jgi:hypothetical protein
MFEMPYQSTCRGAVQEDYVPEGEVMLTVENKSPLHDTFQFQRITGGLTR